LGNIYYTPHYKDNYYYDYPRRDIYDYSYGNYYDYPFDRYDYERHRSTPANHLYHDLGYNVARRTGQMWEDKRNCVNAYGSNT